MSHGEALPSPHAWVFSGQAGFAGSAQVPDLREIFDFQIRQGLWEAVPIFFDFFQGKSKVGPSGWIRNYPMMSL